MKIKKFWWTVFLILFLSVLFSSKINLFTADLGRHIKNGEFVFKNTAVLSQNFYSYTNTDYPFLNHHWGSGVIFYLINNIFGFKGCSFFYAVISALTVIVFFLSAKKNSNLFTAGFSFVLALPLLLYRGEVRPEAFSYLFCGIFYYLLKNKSRYFLLPLIMLFWVNLHAYFFLGFFLIGIFVLEDIFKKESADLKKLLTIAVFCLFASLINPAGIKGVLYPLHIFDQYGYRLLENQSIFFLKKVLGDYPVGIYFFISFLIFVFSFILSIFKNRKINISNFILSLFINYLALKAVRNFSLFGLFLIPLMSENLKEFKFTKNESINTFLFIILSSLLVPALFLIKPIFWLSKNFGFGTKGGETQAANFFKENNLKGPIFNNYDIGGYLIYFLFPQEKVFVDNRPEAYPVEFFTKIYVPMQENEDIWKEKSDEYKFNVIFFYYRDLTPWAQNFLGKRIADKNWVPVYADKDAIIFLKNNTLNKSLIEKFKIPSETFSMKK